MDTHVAIGPLKSFSKSQLKDCPLLRQMILEEADEMSNEEFVMKAKVWLRLLQTELEAKDSGPVGLLHNRLVVRQ